MRLVSCGATVLFLSHQPGSNRFRLDGTRGVGFSYKNFTYVKFATTYGTVRRTQTKTSKETNKRTSRPKDTLTTLTSKSYFIFFKMQNESGENVDLYVPRKCSWTNRLIEAKDHSAIQINVANVDPVTGVATGESTPYALGGYIRFKSEGDMALTELTKKNDAIMFATD